MTEDELLGKIAATAAGLARLIEERAMIDEELLSSIAATAADVVDLVAVLGVADVALVDEDGHEDEDEPYTAHLDLLDDYSGWAVSLWDPRLPEVVPWWTVERVDDAVEDLRSHVARILNVDRNSFEVDVTASIDEMSARMLDGLHNVGRMIDEPPPS